MDLPWGDEKTRKFLTNVGLVTSNGSVGHNIMACEWTHHISYRPGLIAVSIGSRHATHNNIDQTKEFGINIASIEQNVIASISGSTTGKEYDKIKVLEEIGFEFYKAKKIDVFMVKDASLNLECKLFKKIDLGDHTMFVGEVVESNISDKKPLAYHDGKYWSLEQTVEKPAQEELEKINEIIKKHKKN